MVESLTSKERARGCLVRAERGGQEVHHAR